MKRIILSIVYIAVALTSLSQISQFDSILQPLLSRPVESGFFHFNMPNSFDANYLYQQYRTNAPDLDNDLALKSIRTDNMIGYTHYKYQQTYKGIPVEGAGCIAHYRPDGSLSFINAKFVDSMDYYSVPELDPRTCVNLIIERIRNGEEKEVVFAWEDEGYEQDIKIVKSDSSATHYPEAELIWAVDKFTDMHLFIDKAKYILAYKFTIKMLSPDFKTSVYYVNANTGAIFKERDAYHYDGPAHITNYGILDIDTQYKGFPTNKYILHTNNNGVDVHTKEFNSTWAFALRANIKDDDDDWDSNDEEATTAHYFTSMAWLYYKDYFSREGFNDDGDKVRVSFGNNAINAYFDNDSEKDLIFGVDNNGDGIGGDMAVVAHEFTHGITHFTAELEYEFESGAINESFSDIFGVLAQAYMLDGGVCDWVIGDGVSLGVEGTRSLENPNLSGTHYDPNTGLYGVGQPDCFGGQFYYDGTNSNVDYGGVHINSGVMNKWAFILSEGESGTNDLNDFYNVQGIGMLEMGNIAYYALENILMESSGFTDAREASLAAAELIFGECSFEHQEVANAWFAVGVGDETDCTFTLGLSVKEDKNLIVYPNPTNDYINVYFDGDKGDAKLLIVDMYGKTVYDQNQQNQMLASINLENFSSGVYIIKYYTGEGVYSKRFVYEK